MTSTEKRISNSGKPAKANGAKAWEIWSIKGNFLHFTNKKKKLDGKKCPRWRKKAKKEIEEMSSRLQEG